MSYTPLTGASCGCKRGIQRDNCPNCEGSGLAIDFRAIHARRIASAAEASELYGDDECERFADELRKDGRK